METSQTRASHSRWQAKGILGGLAFSAVALSLAPALMPAGYSWVAHTTSESAAQGLEGAWLARLGFLTFGLTVVWLTVLAENRWGRWATGLHRAFGVFLTGTAAFSHKPFDPTVTYDQFEDLLHSIAATAMGFAFALGVVAVVVGRLRRVGLVDVVAVAASILIPLAMVAAPGGAGLLQRTMFAVAYFWYAREAVGAARGGGR